MLPDDVMLSASARPSRGQDAPLSPFSDPSVPQISLQMQPAPLPSSYPRSQDFNGDVYTQIAAMQQQRQQQQQNQVQQMLATQAQLMDEISDGGGTNDSDRNSSPFYQEASDYDEDFVPASTRGRGRGGGAKKKPGRGGSTGTRRQTNPGPSGFFSATQLQAMSGDFSHLHQPQQTSSTRGKRGKRGNGTSVPRQPGKGPGRGRGRGRGSAAAIAQLAQLQQVQYGAQGAPMFNGAPQLHPTQPTVAPTLPPSVTYQNVAPTAPPAPPALQTPLPDPLPSIVPSFQQAPQAVAIREVDELMLEDESSRQSGGSRSDEPEYIRTAIVCRVNDEFLQKACMCLVCGSIGKGPEGSMVACSNCAQTYHTYCVTLHDKLNSAVVGRGWRCLDCTVCEGCGTGGDEANLLLCDECDVSYHIYCMKPLLDKIPQGPWRCQWCSRCRRCNHKAASGNDLTSQGLCFPCASLRKCPRCERNYQLNEKLIRCSQCSKWQHGACEGLYTDEQLEQAAIDRMRCSACRPKRVQPSGFSDVDTVWCDYVALDKDAHEILKSKYTPSALKNHMMESVGYRESFDHYDDDYNPLEDSSDQVTPLPIPGQRGRGRGNPSGRRGMNRIGIGGFYAKLPRHRIQALTEEAAAAAASSEDSKQAKRPRKSRRSQLEDAYPPQIQEAFFGIKAVEGKVLVDTPVDEPFLAEFNGWYKRTRSTKAFELCMTASEMLRTDIDENEFLDCVGLPNMETDALDDFDFNLLEDFDVDEENDELENSLLGAPGNTEMKEDAAEGIEGSYGPTSFNLDQRPSTSSAGGSLGSQDPFHPGMNPANFAQHAPGVRNAIARSGSQTDNSERYQFSARWEEDEPNGLQATTAAVLYSNEKHGYLRQQFPNWVDRVKQIQKLWRTLNHEVRLDYVNRARDNRTRSGNRPRPRRTNVQSTDSPPPPQMGFKVPANPSSNMMGSSEQSMQPKQVFITHHLPMDVYQVYQDLKRVKFDRERLNGSLEEQLNKARKQKKNLAAKKRQMVKTQTAAPDYDGRNIDLNESDQQTLATLTEQIKVTQAEIELHRRDLKKHESNLSDFVMKHGILRNEHEVKREDVQLSAIRDQQYAAHADEMLAQQAQNQGLGQVHPPVLVAPQAAISLPMLNQQQQHHQRMMQMQMRGGPPGQFMMRAQPPQQPQINMHNHEIAKRMLMQQFRNAHPVMGGIRHDEITDPIMRDVYDCLEAIVFDVHTVAEREAMQAAGQQPPPPHIMQRMMQQHPGGPGGPRLIMPGQFPQLQGRRIPQQPPPVQLPQVDVDPPKTAAKRKKGGGNPKKNASSYPAAGEYDAWIEQMRMRFRLCPDIPKKQKEPRLNRPGCEFVSHGLTDMAVRATKKRTPLVGEFGAMRVKRGTRLFGNEERGEKSIMFQDLNLYQVEPQIRLFALYNNPLPTMEDDVFRDEEDQIIDKPTSALQKLLNKKRGASGAMDHIRSRARYMEETNIPPAPERGMFYENVEAEEEVTVELVFNTCDITEESSVDEKKDVCGRLHEQIRDLLAIKDEVAWSMEDTPPESPVSRSPEPEATVGAVQQTSSTSRAPSEATEREIKREVEEEAAPVAPEIKREIVEPSQSQNSSQCKNCQKALESHSSTSIVTVKAEKLNLAPTGSVVTTRAAPVPPGVPGAPGAPIAPSEEKTKEELASFCSKKCYYELASATRAPLTEEEVAAAEQHVSEEVYNKLKQVLTENIVKAVSQGKKPDPQLTSPRDTRCMMDEGRRENVTIVPVASLIGAVEAPKEAPSQRAAEAAEDWKAYTKSIWDSFVNIQQQHAHHILSPKIGVPHPPYHLDKRICVFCGGIGDGETTRCGRLISLTEFYWVHVNCALWSAEVFENQTGGLTNVDRAVLRAAQTACDHCKRPGASVKCHKMNCGVNYHVLCAMQNNGFFIKDRTFICKQHEKVSNQAIVGRLDALRRIYVKRDENTMLTRLFELTDGPTLCMRLGAFTFYKIGSITPKQLKRFHTKDYIFPNNYRITRLFWSPKSHRERMMFECIIEDRNNQPIFVVKSLEDPTICYKAVSASKAWQPIYEKVHQLREQQQGDSLKFFGSQICGETLFGLNENAITKITESLPGFDTIFTYQHRHQNSPVLELPLAENLMGCARAEPRNRTIGQHFRTKPQPMGGTHHHIGSASGLSSQATIIASSSSSANESLQSRQAATSVTSANSGRTRGVRSYYTEEAAARARAFGIPPEMASLSLRMETTQNAQTAFSAYQKMRREWKDRVYLARSRIAGLGLYAKVDISMGDFIIEYKGEIIRSEVCEVREIRYVAQNRGVYMFRIDEEWVIDATMAGGPARYINHSCDPNCSTQILDAGSGAREKKIIITANRPISANEELTYDYQFELEGTTDKIPCLCGAPNCVKWMN